MKIKGWHIFLALVILWNGALLLNCKDKGTQPQDSLDVSNDNPHCGLLAGFVKSASGKGLGGVTVSISPLAQTQPKGEQGRTSLSGFMNYPNPFMSDTHLTYFLSAAGASMVRVSIYDLQQELLCSFPNAPTDAGPNKLYFDGLNEADEMLPNGLYPCEILASSAGQTDSLRIALSKGINIAAQGGASILHRGHAIRWKVRHCRRPSEYPSHNHQCGGPAGHHPLS